MLIMADSSKATFAETPLIVCCNVVVGVEVLVDCRTLRGAGPTLDSLV